MLRCSLRIFFGFVWRITTFMWWICTGKNPLHSSRVQERLQIILFMLSFRAVIFVSADSRIASGRNQKFVSLLLISSSSRPNLLSWFWSQPITTHDTYILDVSRTDHWVWQVSSMLVALAFWLSLSTVEHDRQQHPKMCDWRTELRHPDHHACLIHSMALFLGRPGKPAHWSSLIYGTWWSFRCFELIFSDISSQCLLADDLTYQNWAPWSLGYVEVDRCTHDPSRFCLLGELFP